LAKLLAYPAYTCNKAEREAEAQANYDKRVEELDEPLQDLLNEFFTEHGELSEADTITLTFKPGSRNF
jgi:hypothetical protein